MIGLDTSVLVRYFTQDDPIQAPKANALIASLSPTRPGFVSQAAVIELVWVVTRHYELSRQKAVAIIECLLQSRSIVVEAAEAVSAALHRFASLAVGFADCLIERVGHAYHCEYTATFDRRAVRLAGFRLIG